ncbi:hypothetical protein BAUCODRAFT_194891 [Baudoinia panamericana UAMH 10762]|uniref:Uncharacterized protein n=1 Tax=Baudoinia panamericana (strain UAMH 10762) TaxID=717646 RepID=M2NA41_BAUPA|nr:uncharacterized protein BAUCODRAFT_194891 [Baudoinia panamericana UAMH 10762]EMD01084.1 hypothetical protein BAUCODRAFT_194891 [Baudoinia panamericana UAMH 10762]
MAQTSSRALTSSLDKLTISGKQQKKKQPAESWEDEDSEEDSGTTTPIRPVSSSSYPDAPPPTPSSPSFSPGKGTPYQSFPPADYDESSYTAKGSDERRPDKSTAVASRLIAAGIGQKAPKRTKEQREYDQAVKIQEKKRRDQIKAEEERRKAESERAKQAIWDD